MSRLFELLKLNFRLSRNGKIIYGKKYIKFTAMIILKLFILGLVFYIQYRLFDYFKIKNEYILDYFLDVSICITVFIIFIRAFYTYNTYLFNNDNYSLLEGLPINNRTIVLSRMIKLSFDYLSTSFILIGSAYIINCIFIYKSFNLVESLIILSYIIIIPIFPIAIGCLISLPVYLFKMNKYFKSIVYTVYSCLFGLLIFFYFKELIVIEDKFDLINRIINNFSLFTSPFEKMIKKDLIDYTLIIISIVSFIFLFLILTVSFNYSSHIQKHGKLKVKKKSLKIISVRSNFLSILLFDFHRYFRNFKYYITLISGQLIYIVIVIAFIYTEKDIDITLGEKIREQFTISDLTNFKSIVFALLVIFLIAFIGLTGSSITFEKKKLWIKKTLPVSKTMIYMTKIVENIIVFFPGFILSFIFIYLKFNITIELYILEMFICFLFFSGDTLLSLSLNICLEKDSDINNKNNFINKNVNSTLKIIHFLYILIMLYTCYKVYVITNIKITLIISLLFSILYLIFALFILVLFTKRGYEKLK